MRRRPIVVFNRTRPVVPGFQSHSARVYERAEMD